MKNLNYWSREDFEKLPHRKWNEEIICDSIIILPVKFDWIGLYKYWIKYYLSELFDAFGYFLKKPEIYEIKHMHDSGYRCMDFVAVEDNEPKYLLSGCSDVIHIEGIGGYGYQWYEKYRKVPEFIKPCEWSIDCLASSGFLRIFPRSRRKIICGEALSSFEIWSTHQTETEG